MSRELWLTEEVKQKLDAWPFPSDLPEKTRSKERKDINSFLTDFIVGRDMSIGIGQDFCDIKALAASAGQPTEGWELRIIPGSCHTRIFGVFVTPQDFVATDAFRKQEMPGKGKNSQSNFAMMTPAKARALLKSPFISLNTKPPAAALGGGSY